MEARHGRLRDAALHLLEHGPEEHAHGGREDLFIVVCVVAIVCVWVGESPSNLFIRST